MREIKFRVWDKITNQLVYLDEISFVNYGIDGKYKGFELSFGAVANKAGQPHDWLRDKDEYVLQQFTGLKDKNGNEIYEGDIIKCSKEQMEKNNTPMTYSRDYFGIVEYNPPIYSIKSSEYSPIFWGGIEIIGNTFENPELT